MIQKLIILGLLKKNPSSGYDIKKFMSKELGIFSEVENNSIYYPLNKMAKEGLIEKKEIKLDKQILKYIYSITPKGDKEFLRLCQKALLSQKRPFIELDIALYFLPFLDKKAIIPLLRLRLLFLEKVKNWLTAKQEALKSGPDNLTLLIEHHSKLAEAEKSFLKDMINVVKKEKCLQG